MEHAQGGGPRFRHGPPSATTACVPAHLHRALRPAALAALLHRLAAHRCTGPGVAPAGGGAALQSHRKGFSGSRPAPGIDLRVEQGRALAGGDAPAVACCAPQGRLRAALPRPQPHLSWQRCAPQLSRRPHVSPQGGTTTSHAAAGSTCLPQGQALGPASAQGLQPPAWQTCWHTWRPQSSGLPHTRVHCSASGKGGGCTHSSAPAHTIQALAAKAPQFAACCRLCCPCCPCCRARCAHLEDALLAAGQLPGLGPAAARHGGHQRAGRALAVVAGRGAGVPAGQRCAAHTAAAKFVPPTPLVRHHRPTEARGGDDARAGRAGACGKARRVGPVGILANGPLHGDGQGRAATGKPTCISAWQTDAAGWAARDGKKHGCGQAGRLAGGRSHLDGTAARMGGRSPQRACRTARRSCSG